METLFRASKKKRVEKGDTPVHHLGGKDTGHPDAMFRLMSLCKMNDFFLLVPFLVFLKKPKPKPGPLTRLRWGLLKLKKGETTCSVSNEGQH
jgi:hypothetical protein